MHFIARYNDNWVLATNQSYSPVDFSWSDPSWPVPSKEGTERTDDFSNTVREFPVDPRAKLICVGRNYAAHAQELGNEIPDQPLLFFKPSSSLLGPNGIIEIPKMSANVHYEGELVVVVGKRGRFIPEEEALSYVFGYTIGLDMTARDLQRSDKTWFRGKGFDTFAPVGPWVAPPEAVDLNDCNLCLTLNGEVRQEGNTRDLIFKVPFLIHYISQIVTLEPGDLIFTGTPEGVGQVQPSDLLTVSIDGIGQLNASVGHPSH